MDEGVGGSLILDVARECLDKLPEPQAHCFVLFAARMAEQESFGDDWKFRR